MSKMGSLVRSKHVHDPCLSAAPTAMAAELIGAHTVDSTFLFPRDPCEKRFPFSEEYKANFNDSLKKVKFLFIDGINYVTDHKFKLISNTLQAVFKNTEPFGGISVVVFGDFRQLQPLQPQTSTPSPENLNAVWRANSLWDLFRRLELTENRRIENEDEKKYLNAIRISQNSRDAVNYLQRHCRMPECRNASDVVKTFNNLRNQNPGKSFAVVAPTGKMVDQINEKILQQYGATKDFLPKDSVNYLRGRTTEYFRAGKTANDKLTIAKGAPVILTNNHESIVHGTCGTVRSYTEDIVTVEFGGKPVDIPRYGWFEGNYGWKQFPLRVAGAFTIHRIQGMSFDGIVLVKKLDWSYGAHSLSDGHFYTIMSRARNLKLCRITPLTPLTWKTSRDVGMMQLL